MNQFRNRTELSLTAKPKSNQRIEETETAIGTEKKQKREMTLVKIGKGLEQKIHLLLFDTPLNYRIVSLTPTQDWKKITRAKAQRAPSV